MNPDQMGVRTNKQIYASLIGIDDQGLSNVIIYRPNIKRCSSFIQSNIIKFPSTALILAF